MLTLLIFSLLNGLRKLGSKVELKRFGGELDVGTEENRSITNDSQVLECL